MRDFYLSIGTGLLVAGIIISNMWLFALGGLITVIYVFIDYYKSQSVLVGLRSLFGNIFAALVPTGLSASDIEVMVIVLLFAFHALIITIITHLLIKTERL